MTPLPIAGDHIYQFVRIQITLAGGVFMLGLGGFFRVDNQPLIHGGYFIVTFYSGGAAAAHTETASQPVSRGSGVVKMAAGGALVISGVGMTRVAFADICMGCVRALVGRNAEVALFDFPPPQQHSVAFVGTVIVGVAFDGENFVSLNAIDDAYMGKIFFKEQIAPFGRVVGTMVAGDSKARVRTGVSQGGALERVGGDLRLVCTPADEAGTPRRIGETQPIAVLGVIIRAFGIAYLGHGNTNQIFCLIAGVHIGVFIGSRSGGCQR